MLLIFCVLKSFIGSLKLFFEVVEFFVVNIVMVVVLIRFKICDVII